MSLQRREKQQARIATKVTKEIKDDIAPDGRMLTKAELMLFRTLAESIRDNEHLAEILQSVAPDRREVIYEQIKPFVTFPCREFDALFPKETVVAR